MTQSEQVVDVHEAVEADFADYYEEALSSARAAEVKEHLGSCRECRAAYDEFKETLNVLSGLNSISAPQNFQDGVADTIRRRSGGRFFGRKAFGDRVPFELLAVVALIIALIAFVLIRSSETGSLRYDDDSSKPTIVPGAKEALPSHE